MTIAKTETPRRKSALSRKPVPAQIVRAVKCAPRRHLFDAGAVTCEDNLALLQRLPDECCQLIYADPPFNSGRRRTSRRDRNGFRDHWPGPISEYLDFLAPRLTEMHRVLSPNGSLYLHLDWRTVHYAKVLLDGIFDARNFLNEIVWHYRTGGNTKRWFARKHDTILLYAKDRAAHKFNVLRTGQYRTDGLNHNENGRPYKSTTRGRLYFNPAGPAVTDVWDIPFLSTVSLERVGYPSQKPLALLDRIIRASSDPGHLVADFFCGSGTTLLAANRLNRPFLGCDIQSHAFTTTVDRLTA